MGVSEARNEVRSNVSFSANEAGVLLGAHSTPRWEAQAPTRTLENLKQGLNSEE